MASTGQLTQRSIADLTARSGSRYVVWDGGIPGFGVRVSDGAKTFILKYRLASRRTRWATLARVGVMTLEQARTLARAYLGALAKGEDPLRRKDLARTAPTVAEVADRFLKEYVGVRAKRAPDAPIRSGLKPSTRRLYVLAIDTHIRPSLGTVAIADVSLADVLRLHQQLRGTPVMANRVLAVCSKFMTWAEQHEYRTQRTNPCRGIRKYKEEARRRYLTPREMTRLGAALRIGERWHAMSPTAVTAIRLLLLTGARVSEILSLRWAEVDLVRGALRLPESKTGRKTILLSPPAVAILDVWPRFGGSPYVFPGEGPAWRKGDHRVNLTDAWRWIRRRAKIADVRLHDLRHSFASVAVSSGQTLPMIGALLGHKEAATTQRYAHLMDDPLRAASDATAATIAAAIAPRRVR
ncbi:MAG: tyrosine-type recombinase/integrase [Vicinamibacterales bacterium]